MENLEDFLDSKTCPIRDIIAKFGDKWSLLVFAHLSHHEKMRFNEFMKEIDDISQRMLTVTLRSLEADGLIRRKVFAEVPPRVEYQLTELGFSLQTPISHLVAWARDNATHITESRKRFDKVK